MIVDLAVEHDTERPILGPHRLLTAADIDDRQPAMTEEDAGGLVDPSALGIRAAMRNRVVHPAQYFERAFSCNAADPAHRQAPAVGGCGRASLTGKLSRTDRTNPVTAAALDVPMATTERRPRLRRCAWLRS